MTTINAVLFDLDGTLVDSAPDYVGALNELLAERGRAKVPFESARDHVSHGAWALLKIGLGREVDRTLDYELRSRLLELYLNRLTRESQLFDGIAPVLATLDQRGLPWGIVTNKPGFLTDPLLEALRLTDRAACIVSGDTLPLAKPHPDPILHACEVMQVPPVETVMIGDARADIDAGRAAGSVTVAAVYGYVPPDERLETWGADARISAPSELLPYLSEYLASDS